MLGVAGVETKLFIVPQQKLFHDSENTNLKIQSFLGVLKTFSKKQLDKTQSTKHNNLNFHTMQL